jgi:hypothetical protein
MAAAGLLFVVGLGAALFASRLRGDRGARSEVAATAAAAAPAATAAAPAAAATANTVRARVAGDARTADPQPSETTAVATPEDEVPVWQRRPLRTTQPFPEGARFDPPMPPIKIPPEMLIPIPSADAAPAPP